MHPCPLGFDVWWCHFCGEWTFQPDFKCPEVPSCCGHPLIRRVGASFEESVPVFDLRFVRAGNRRDRRLVHQSGVVA